MKKKISFEVDRPDITILFGGPSVSNNDSSVKLDLDYILDRNGRLGYLNPSASSQPAFLKFLNMSTIKGKLVKGIIN